MILEIDDLRWYRNQPIVLLDGAFDPLHAGHLRYFAESLKAFPSHLRICAVASDDDIRAKGREPFYDQRTRAEIVHSLKSLDLVVLKNCPTEHLIGKLKPGAYVKGKDWEGRLPDEQLVACSLHGVQIVYLSTVTDSSSDRLRSWALRDAERGLGQLEDFISKQSAPSVPWQPVTDYSFEARKIVEGRHPRLIKEAFPGMRVLDAGCGPDGILVRLLGEIGVSADGFDKTPPIGDGFFPCSVSEEWFPRNDAYAYDVAICREVLEHLTVPQVNRAVANLFRWASRFIYITTRFSDKGVFDADTEFDADPTHITCLSQPFLRALCVLNGGKRRRDLEQKLDWMNKGRVLVYQVQ